MIIPRFGKHFLISFNFVLIEYSEEKYKKNIQNITQLNTINYLNKFHFILMISHLTTFLFWYLYGSSNKLNDQDAALLRTNEYAMNGSEIISKSPAFVQDGGFGLQPQNGTFVDENCPWLHVEHPMYNNSDINSVKKAKTARLKYKRFFYFELSLDPQFQKDVYRSGKKRWSFYNPYVHLEKGTWYWRYGVADPDTPDDPVWVDKVYCFIIRGNEFKVPIPPKPEVFLNAVISHPAPTFLLLREEFGTLLPTKKWKYMADWARNWYEKQYKANTSMKFTVSDQDAINAGYVDANGKANAKQLFYEMRIRALSTAKGRYISNLIAAYILIGDKKYLDLAINKMREYNEWWKTARFYIESLNWTYVTGNADVFSYQEFLDIAPEVLSKEEIDKIVKANYKGTWDPPADFESAEHSVYDQHLWQAIIAKFERAMTFARYHEEAREELRYVYELWLFRAPSVGRNDGGSLEGDGYLGVHDDYLGTVPWIIYKLTGYNFFLSTKWYTNIGKYLTYINPFGSAGNGFCDGDGGGATMPYTLETLAHLVPDNYWNLWRFKTISLPDANKFTADLGKGNKAYALLSLWNYFDAPNVSNLEAPKEMAAVFKDIGEVGMHTSLTNKKKDLQVTFHSSPYGSLMHTHPAQNAFNLAYGGEILFWKSGFYNGGGWHNLLSYKCSRAHNTIMAGGIVQGFHRTAYGWIARFASGEKISYTLGDASKAYNGKNRYNTDKDPNPILADPRYGGGNPNVTKFRRHIAMLRPNHVIIYDELEAKQPITWEFRLHSRTWMTRLGDEWLMGKNSYATASAKLFCKEKINTTLLHKYLPNEDDGINPVKDLKPEEMWLLRPSDDENKLPKPIPEHYHGAYTTIGKFTKMRFFTLIEIHPGQNETFVPIEPKAVKNGDLTTIQAGDYTIDVQLDGELPSFFQVKNKNETASLVTGTAAQKVVLGNETKRAKRPGSTLLFEKGTYKGDIFLEEVDTLPDILLYGNRF